MSGEFHNINAENMLNISVQCCSIISCGFEEFHFGVLMDMFLPIPSYPVHYLIQCMLMWSVCSSNCIFCTC